MQMVIRERLRNAALDSPSRAKLFYSINGFYLIITNVRVCLQLLLRKKAAEELKKEQERKAAERRRIIEERCGKAKDTDNASEGTFTPFKTFS